MRWPRISALLIKEWREFLRNRGVLWTMVALAALMVALPIGLLSTLPAAELAEVARSRQSQALLRLMTEHVGGFAELGR